MIDLPVILGGIGAVILAVLAVFGLGRSSGIQKERNDDLQEDVETAKRIDAVRSLDADAARERLRKRKPSGDL